MEYLEKIVLLIVLLPCFFENEAQMNGVQGKTLLLFCFNWLFPAEAIVSNVVMAF